MADLATLANIAEILGVLALIGGGWFAWFQIREARISRDSHSALTVLNNFMRDEDFFVAINHLMRLPDDWAEDPVLTEDRDTIRVAERVYLSMEMLGYFVFAKMVRLQDVIDVGGSGILASWKKMEGYVSMAREFRGKNAFEWFEWLAHQIEKAGTHDRPAIENFSDWQP